MTAKPQPTATDFESGILNEADSFLNSDEPAAENLQEVFTERPLTDTGNAECFLAKYGNDYKYDVTIKNFLRWGGNCWGIDEKNAVDSDILEIIRLRQKAVADRAASQNEGAQKIKDFSYLVRCENSQNRRNIKTAVQLLKPLVTKIDEYDSDKNLAATKNGTLDLSAAEHRQSIRKDLISMQLGTHYDETANCPRWEQFLNEIFPNDEELIRWIQKIIGYSLTGSTEEHLMFILYGFGKNGKSVFINVLQALFGDYAGAAGFKTFDEDKRNEQTNDIAALRGKRFVSMVETGADKRLNEALMKRLTGGDALTCRFLHKEFFTYTAHFKLFLATNHKPVIPQNDYATWRRIRLIPFMEKFEKKLGKNPDKKLEQKLKSELPGILNWALEGLRNWQKEGLEPTPATVIKATEKYKQDSDTVGQWLEFRTDTTGSGETQSSVAYRSYLDWAKDNGFFPLSSKSLKAALEEKGFQQARRKDAIYWQGFALTF